MPFNLIIKEEAVFEIDAAYDYYEGQKRGLGQRFLTELEFQMAALSITPHSYSFFLNSQRFRSHALDVFPFSIIYEILDMDVIVYAVYNTHKNPTLLFKMLPK